MDDLSTKNCIKKFTSLSKKPKDLSWEKNNNNNNNKKQER